MSCKKSAKRGGVFCCAAVFGVCLGGRGALAEIFLNNLSQTPAAGIYTYTISLDQAANVQTNDGFVIYDFPGLASWSITGGLSSSQFQLTQTLTSNVLNQSSFVDKNAQATATGNGLPFDNPTIPNLSFSYVGPPADLTGADAAVLTLNSTVTGGATYSVGVSVDHSGSAGFPYSYASGIFAVPAEVNQWAPAGGGTWGVATNWTASVIPANPGDAANFLGNITAGSTVTLDGDRTVGAVTFNNSNSYTLTSGTGGTLFLDNGSSAATVTDVAGTHTISAPVGLNSSAAVAVNNSGDTLTFSGAITGSGGLTVSGSGSFILSGSNSYGGATNLSAGSVVLGGNALPANTSLTIGTSSTTANVRISFAPGVPIGPTSTVSGLTINPGSQLNITNHDLVISYGSAANDPVTTIRTQLTAAYKAKYSGANLPLTSSTAAASPSLFAVGYVDNTSTHQLTVGFTIPGDTNLSGATDFTDLTTVAQFFGQSIAKGNNVSWSTGDVNYDNQVDFSDLTLVAQYFGQSLTKSQASELPASFVAQYNLALAEVRGGTSSVPEPGMIGVFAVAAVGLMVRRRARVS